MSNQNPVTEKNLGGEKVTKKDLKEVKSLNRVGISGTSSSLPAFDDLLGWVSEKKEDKLDRFTYNLISCLKNWQFQKFQYENLPEKIPVGEIEKLLFWYGGCAFFKIDEKIFVSSFEIKKYDFYYHPKKIKILAPNQNFNENKFFTVGKDCEILYNDNSNLFMSKPFFGTLFRVYDHLKLVQKTYNNLRRNVILSRQWVKLPFATESELVTELESILNSEDLILRMDNNFLTNLKSRNQNDDLTFDIPDKTDSYWENFYNSMDYLKSVIGIKTNANLKKKERQISDEISVNNEFSNSQIEAMRLTRENGLKKINKTFDLKIILKINDDLTEEIENDKMENEEEKGEN